MFPDDIVELARQVIEEARARRLTIATAESCTGGLVAGALTAIPGSSDVLDRGLVTYSNTAKTDLLGVAEALIASEGAVSESVARAMAEGARRTSGADLAVSITGIAGPGGGSAVKPVGLVHFASAGPLSVAHLEQRFGDIGRDGIRLASVRTALNMLLQQMSA